MDETQREGSETETGSTCAVRGWGEQGRLRALPHIQAVTSGAAFISLRLGSSGALWMVTGSRGWHQGCAKAEPLPGATKLGCPQRSSPAPPFGSIPQTLGVLCSKRGEKCRIESSLAWQQGEEIRASEGRELLHSSSAPSSHLQGMEQQQSPSGHVRKWEQERGARAGAGVGGRSSKSSRSSSLWSPNPRGSHPALTSPALPVPISRACPTPSESGRDGPGCP